MLQSLLRRTARDERGFTLIELLVVILIIGILAAIAIPSFLNQKSKATDASAKELAHTAQVAAETYATDNAGSYGGLSQTVLQTYESTIQIASGNNNAYLSAASADGSGQGYTVTTTSPSGDSFSITRLDSGTLVRSCTGPGSAAVANGQVQGGCVGTASGGSW